MTLRITMMGNIDGVLDFVDCEGNFEEQGKIIKKQDKVIEEMQRYIDNRKDIIDSLGDN